MAVLLRSKHSTILFLTNSIGFNIDQLQVLLLIVSTEENKSSSSKDRKMHYSMGIKIKTWAGDMALQLKAYVVFPDNICLFYSTHVRGLTTIYNSTSRGPSLGLLRPAIRHTNIHRHTYIHTIKNTNKNLGNSLLLCLFSTLKI